MKVIVKDNYDEASLEAFKIMKEVVVNKPNAVLGLQQDQHRWDCIRI